MSWIVWLVLAAVLGVAELLTVTLTLGLIAVAAAVAAVVGGLGAPVPFQVLAFVVAAGAGLVLVRPIAVRHLKQPPTLTATMLRSVIGSMDLEDTLTSRDKINNLLRGVLDDASGKWGIRVTRVEIKAIDPPKSVVDAMEKQMRAEREKRAAILTAEGVKQAKILTAEGEKRNNLKRRGKKRPEGQAQAIGTV